LTGKLVFHESEVVADEIENLFDREQCDGFPPGLFLCSRFSGRGPLGPRKTEKTPEILGSRGGNFVSRQVSHTRKHARYFRNVGGLIALAAAGLRRQVRRVRFYQYFFKR
jgi:hypothetical protein